MKRLFLFLALLFTDPAAAQNVFFPGNPGDMIWRNTTGWDRVPGGTAGQLLMSNGPAAQPVWTFDLSNVTQLIYPRIATNRVLGNVTGSTASPIPITINQWLDTIGYDVMRPPQLGSLIYKDAVAQTWQSLQPGGAGFVLASGGPTANPYWTFIPDAATPGAAGTCLVSNGPSVAPTYQACPITISVASCGATGDGSDQTVAIRQCINNTPAGGQLFFPCGTYAISGSGTEVFLRETPIGLIAANNCVRITTDGVGNSTTIFRFTPDGITNQAYGWRVSNFFVFALAGTHANHFIEFDTNGSNTGLILFAQINGNVVFNLNGNSVYFNNALPSVNVTGTANNGSGAIRLQVTSTTGMISGMMATVANVGGTTEANGTWQLTVIDGTHIDLVNTTFSNAWTAGGTVVAANATGGTAVSTISNNAFQNPIALNYAGDSIAIQNNNLSGSGACITGQQVIGAGNLQVEGNNMSCAAGMVVLDGGAKPVIFANELEQTATNTESNNCMIDLRGSARMIDTASINNNQVQALTGFGNPTPVCITNANGAVVDNNRLSVPSAYALVTIGASSTNTKIGLQNILIQGTSTVATSVTTVTNSGTSTEWAIPSTVPLGTSGGIPYFDANGRMGTSAAQNINGVLIGGGPNAPPFTSIIAVDGQLFQGRSALQPIFTSTPTLGIAGTTKGTLTFAGNVGGTTVLEPSATATGTLTLPAATDTLVGKATTDIFTNKTFDTAGTGNFLRINSNTVNAVTGSGSTVVLSASPTMTNPSLGVATATTLNNYTFTVPAASATLTIANGKTLTYNNSVTLAGTDGTTMTFPTTSTTLAGRGVANTFTAAQTISVAGGGVVALLSVATTNFEVLNVVNTGGNVLFGTESSTGGTFSGTTAYAGIFGTANATNLEFATNNAKRLTVDSVGHIKSFMASAPTVTACGTGSPAIATGSTDVAGSVTTGTGTPTACTINFASSYTTAPFCTVTWRVNLASMQYSVSTTGIGLVQTATSGNVIDWHCLGI